ncbi:S46 family peptidase [Williamwhitmania taraxaci]|uniref:Peptidase S46 n=1 Tax=Williamwhitmania taraxaci TaxID=1640674 RepID=A0A1G6GJL6_9BACT|nr:S46 family peptidase [Williamwhitmania taraxaci]SDB82033.1 Peptidase S46 [Williamwhitmania taraxaci]
MKRIVIGVLALFIIFGNLRADEGMWLPLLVGKQKMKEMKASGFKLKAEDIYSINHNSLKDAIVQFGGGCTGEVISDEGLIITNHHCGYRQIQEHSSLEHNYLEDGFWAMSKREELSNPNLSVKFLVRMEDVTEKILGGITMETPEEERGKLIIARSAATTKLAIEGTNFIAEVKPLFYGNQYFLSLLSDKKIPVETLVE